MVRQKNILASLKRCRKSDKNIISHQKPTKFANGYSNAKFASKTSASTIHKSNRNSPEQTGEFKARRRHANRPSTKTLTQWRIRKNHHGNGSTLKIRLCVPCIQSNSCQHSQNDPRLDDKTGLNTYCNDNRQRLKFRLQCNTRNSCCSRYDTPPCNHETCGKHPRKRTPG